MNELHVFANELRGEAGVEQALKRLGEDFGIPAPLVLAAAWLGTRSVPPDAALARRLDAKVSEWRDGGSRKDDAVEDADMSLLAELQRLLGSRAEGGRADTLAGWLLLVAPGSASCLEQAHWLRTVRDACPRVGGAVN